MISWPNINFPNIFSIFKKNQDSEVTVTTNNDLPSNSDISQAETSNQVFFLFLIEKKVFLLIH